jgi:hypothetical protein
MIEALERADNDKIPRVAKGKPQAKLHKKSSIRFLF